MAPGRIAPGADPFAPAPPAGSDPFAGPAGADPFAPPAGADPFAPPNPGQSPFSGQDPFADAGELFAMPGTAGPFAAESGGSFGEGAAQQEAIADELFGDIGPGLTAPPPPPADDLDSRFDATPRAGPPKGSPPPPPEATDPFAGDSWNAPPLDISADGPLASDEAAPTQIHVVSDSLREKAKPAPRPAKKSPPLLARPGVVRALRAIGRGASAVFHTSLLLVFLLGAVLWARGGGIDDVVSGELFAVILAGAGASGGEGDLAAVEVQVTRRPLPADPELVVVSGEVENRGTSPVLGARVDVQFGGEGRVFSAYVGHKVDALALAMAADAASLHGLGQKPARADLLPGERAPFVVLVTGVPDGVRAQVKVEPVAVPSG